MDIDEGLICYLEELSCLKLTESEFERIGGDLSKIIGYVDRLKELDTEGVTARSHPFCHVNALRDDVLKASFDRELILKNAPDKNSGMFVARR